MERIIVVKIWDEVLGYIEFNEVTQELYFIYDHLFVKKGIQVSPILEPLSESRYHLSLDLGQKGLYAFFPAFMREILPEDVKQDEVYIKWSTTEKKNVKEIRDIFSKIKCNGLGAISFELYQTADCKEIPHRTRIHRKNIANAIHQNILDYSPDLLELNFLSKGTYRKATILYNESNGDINPNIKYEINDYAHYILKLNDTNRELSDWEIAPYLSLVEYSYYKMALDCGIRMMHSELISYGSKHFFITKRYDRIGSSKVHCLSFCHLSGLLNQPQMASYDDIFSTLRFLKAPYEDFEQVFRMLVFNIVGRNTDDSTQNFSFTMSHEGIWRIAPAYDLCYTYNPNGLYTAHHQMSVNGKLDDFIMEDIIAVGAKNGIKLIPKIINEISSVYQNIDYYFDSRIPQTIRQIIKDNLNFLVYNKTNINILKP